MTEFGSGRENMPQLIKGKKKNDNLEKVHGRDKEPWLQYLLKADAVHNHRSWMREKPLEANIPKDRNSKSGSLILLIYLIP